MLYANIVSCIFIKDCDCKKVGDHELKNWQTATVTPIKDMGQKTQLKEMYIINGCLRIMNDLD